MGKLPRLWVRLRSFVDGTSRVDWLISLVFPSGLVGWILAFLVQVPLVFSLPLGVLVGCGFFVTRLAYLDYKRRLLSPDRASSTEVISITPRLVTVQKSKHFPAPPKRDMSLGQGLAFIITKDWGANLIVTAFVGCAQDELEGRMEQIDEAISEGVVSIWGKETFLGMSFGEFYKKIPKKFWEQNRIKWGNVIAGGEGETEKIIYDGHSVEAYEDLMVSKEQFEKVWCDE